MRSRCCAWFLSLFFSVCLIAYFGGSIDAAAALTGGRYMSVSEARSVFGDQITGTYWDGSDYVSVTFRYNSEFTLGTVESENSYESVFVGARALKYTASSIFPSSEVGQITFDLQPQYSIFDTTQIHSFIALYYSGNYLSSTYDSPNWDWVVNGSRIHTENNDLSASNSGYHAFCGESGSYGAHYTFVPFDFRSQSETSGYSLRACFYGNSSGGGLSYLLLGLPYVDENASGATGTLPDSGGGGSGDINVNVDVDMSETNGLLGGIQNTLNGIVDGIKNLFIPSEEDLEQFSEDMSDLLSDHLGGLYEAEEILADFVDGLSNVSSMSSIDIPVASIPLAGETLELGGWSVPLKVAGMPQILYDGIAWIIDFLATAAFVNMCKKKLEIFLNPDSEVVQSDN